MNYLIHKPNSVCIYVCVCFLTSSRDIDSQAVTCFGSHIKARLCKSLANTLFCERPELRELGMGGGD